MQTLPPRPLAGRFSTRDRAVRTFPESLVSVYPVDELHTPSDNGNDSPEGDKMQSPECEIGIVGLGVMGRNLLLNVADHGFSAAGYDLDAAKVRMLRAQSAGRQHLRRRKPGGIGGAAAQAAGRAVPGARRSAG